MFDSEVIDSNFFIVSSENCRDVQSRLYGYALFDEKLYINGVVGSIPKYADGAYINIYKNGNTLVIQQDYSGSYGLYIYQKDNFFALSNSFYYLFNYLKSRVDLKINSDYVRYFLVDPLSSLSIEETLIEEIKILSQHLEVYVDLNDHTLKTTSLYEPLQKFSLSSKEGVKILDNWYHKWQGILIALYKEKHSITVDLTGGMDSRASFAIFNTDQVDLNKIRINSSTGKFHTHPEDYEIASMIAEKMGFDLNRPLQTERWEVSSNTAIQLSFLAKLGIHKQMFFRKFVGKDWVFCFTGSGGESIRKHWNKMTVEEFVKEQFKYQNFSTLDFRNSIRSIVMNSVQYLMDTYGCADNDQLMKLLYQETRLRTHFGRSTVENFLFGSIFLNPLTDRDLQRIHTNDDTLLCVIYDRYLRNLEGIKFDSKKKLPTEAILVAKSINQKYPYAGNKSHASFQIIDATNHDLSKEYTDGVSPHEKLAELFKLEEVRSLSTKLFGDEMYRKAEINWAKGGHFPERLACALVSLTMIYEGLRAKSDILSRSDVQFQPLGNNQELVLKILNFFKTARIDIKNSGMQGNNIVFDDKNLNVQIASPEWFSQNGIGYVVSSYNLNFDSVLTIVQDGVLQIALRGMDAKDANGSKIPAYIDFISLRIDGVEQIAQTNGISVWHDKPFRYSMPVKNGQKVHIVAKWRPHSYSKEDFINFITSLFDDLPF